jgi:RNAse (barnase) inhibitor barstar
VKPIFEIDGSRFDTLEGFYDEVSAELVSAPWGRNLDAFNDILRGGFGTPDGGFALRWTSSERSRVVLGFEATVRFLEDKLQRCHPTNVPSVAADLEAARRGEGQTLFEIVVEIIRSHDEDGVELELR